MSMLRRLFYPLVFSALILPSRDVALGAGDFLHRASSTEVDIQSRLVPRELSFHLLGGGCLAPTPEKSTADRGESKKNATLTVRLFDR